MFKKILRYVGEVFKFKEEEFNKEEMARIVRAMPDIVLIMEIRDNERRLGDKSPYGCWSLEMSDIFLKEVMSRLESKGGDSSIESLERMYRRTS